MNKHKAGINTWQGESVGNAHTQQGESVGKAQKHIKGGKCEE